ncbi:hypothetical protein [Aquimarina aggregata]|uniref:hypothetical protein n=1 Tax=Aquimarina aggregata TaxID=1642818 RepID=UPI0024913BF3|nr:hypothetical protein [Aquimarina aggregata]
MTEAVNENITVIRQNDPDLPDYLDFEKLRREGLEHIGNLSGKIWTDHNVHDPGITILEVLVYALMDLGYKTNLPFQDLIATLNTSTDTEENFLTPLEILTVNPVTILDFRKLLLEVEGVRNAWLEPVKQEQGLYLDIERRSTVLYCENPNNLFQEIELNGLYKVYIEKDNEIINDTLEQEVKQILVQHRNLCEDFVEVKTLDALEIGVCVEAEIHADFDAEKVYVEIFNNIKKYIQPEITYYTLEELLDKGRTIDNIFAGRPYREKSFGFIDTEELESFTRREFINLSDLYDIILSIDGVRKIKNVSIKGEEFQNMPQTWQYQIEEGKVPAFSKDKTCIDLYNTKGALRIDKQRIERTFSMAKQFEMPLDNLNTKIPIGINRENLEEFYSIQNDFPVVYGIGEDGLPDRASLLRETQALQLKGYLMFYDQILANYTSQLANIKSLFSLTPEEQRTKEQKHTYFTQIPDSIPGVEDLLRFYTNDTETINSLLAVPVKNDSQWTNIVEQLKKNPSVELTIGNICSDTNALIDLFSFSSTGVRSIYINQLIDAFFNEKYTIQLLQDRRGHFFVLQTNLPDDIVMVGTKRYDTVDEARREAKNLTFLGTISQSYKLTTNASDTLEGDQHFFDITYTPISYIDLIQELTEDKSEYALRRKQFLDHLLARFGEEFTDYTILQYQNGIDTEAHIHEEINDQSKYVNRFAEISRNRGKAYDYSISSWNTDNVSGFEKRVSLLSGIENYDRRNLCNFEVVQNFRLELKDWSENVLFRSNRGYESREELYGAAKKVLSQIRDQESYKQLEKSLNGFDAKTMRRIFSEQGEEENIIITKHDYHQQLINTEKEVVVLSKSTKMKSEKVALDKKEDFIKTINTQNILSRTALKSEYRLLPLENENTYLDANALPCEIETLVTWRWHVNTKEKAVSEQVFDVYEDAWDHMIKEAQLEDFLTKHDVAIRWKLPVKHGITLNSIGCYPDAYRAVAAWRQGKALGSSKTNYEIKNEGTSIRIQLKNEKGNPIAISDAVDIGQGTPETILTECTTIFGNRNTKPDYDQEKNKFGFQLLGKDGASVLISYCAYDSEKEALEQLDTVFKLGEVKKNYLLSGDQGNPEYNYILLDKYNSFLALPPDHFETAPDRTKALNSMMRYFKNNTLPVFVKEEPRRYVWSLTKNDKKILESTSEFTSKARAQSDFDKVIVTEAIRPNNELYVPHCYNFEVVATPALYKYRYGISDVNNELKPLFLSTNTFKTHSEASEGYTNFVKELPKLSFKASPKSTTEFGLYSPKSETPMVEGFSKDKPSLEMAKKLAGYLSTIYSNDLAPKESFIARRMVENQNGRFEWRFFKKNTPLAVNPYQYSNESTAEFVKRNICDLIPPINLKHCTKREIVVCPEGSPNKYHYQVEFTDHNKNSFVLISYNGYTSAIEAEEAWQMEWLDVIAIAANPDQYGASGKINLEETYQNSQSKSCSNESFLVVIPKVIREEVEANGTDIITYYSELADVYPIYKKVSESDDNVDDTVSYKFKVVVPQKDLIPTSDSISEVIPHIGSLLWISESTYADEKSVIEAYNHFYNLAGTSNNCRLFCKNGNFYTGLVEVLAESSREFDSEADAWDDAYPNQKDECQDCIPGGVREFIYAAEDDQNYDIVCDREYWKFKVVSPDYFVVDHNCDYNSREVRDQQMDHWISKLKSLNWDQYITGKPSDGGGTRPGAGFLYTIGYGYSDDEFCEFMFNLRDSLITCPYKFAENQEEEAIENNLITSFLEEKYKNDARILDIINRQNFTCELVKELTDYFPIYKTDQGYCFRIYDAKSDVQITPSGLQPCGCEDMDTTTDTFCNEPYPFVSRNYYSCCAEAVNAFTAFCLLITNQNTSYAFEEISKTEYGLYSFQIIDKRKELAYHPQQYDSLQEVKDAIERTKAQVSDVGLHLLEHILLRPTSSGDCFHEFNTGEGEGEGGLQRAISCLLPICPDYDCDIEWQPDLDKDDPCADNAQATLINYIPGSDPYSFWATLVLPAWSKRFRTLEQRETFENFLYKEVPALVGLNILWLGPRDLCNFEDAYRKWLVWKEDPEAYKCNPNDPRPDCLLSNYIRRLESEQPCASAPLSQGDCNCDTVDSRTLPEDSMGSIFWGECVQIIDGDIIDFPVGEVPATIETRPTSKTTVQTESKTVKEVKKEPKELPKKKPTAKSSAKAAVKKAEPVAKAKKTVTKKKVTKTQADKQKTTAKGTSTKTTTAQKKKDELAVVRQRKPMYLKAIETGASENIKKTKSYERTVFFLQNTPTINGYSTLVDFFNRYSLQKDNAISEYLTLLKNATYHLFDNLVLDSKSEIKKEEIDQLSARIEILSNKGLSLKELNKEWNATALGSLANAKSLATIKKLLK